MKRASYFERGFGRSVRPAPAGSQLGIEIGLGAYSVAAGFIIIRCLLLSVGITDNLWVGRFVYGVTDPFAALLKFLPGGDYELISHLTVADLTLLAAVLAVPCFLIARGHKQ
jgi:hypothetical protein